MARGLLTCGRRWRNKEPFVLLGLSLASLTILALSIWSFVRRGQDPFGCEMTYMWPDYVHMNTFQPTAAKLSKYSLFLYKERDGVDSTLQPAGIPVLFIPGNAGSHKQARSLGSVLTKDYRTLASSLGGEQLAKHMPFDVFTIDTDEELAAFQRDLVKDQASYVNDAIQFILSIYPTLPQYEPPFPSAVIVVAHSMGGLVARTLPTLSNFVAGSVNTIITLATPHVAPPAPLEWRLARHYRDLNRVWSQHLGDGPTAVQDTLGLRNSTLISIAGGTHDTMISSALTEVRTFLPPENGFTVYSTSMPNVWTAADHRAILWCNQVVKSLSRALFKVVDSASPQKTIGRADRLEVFNRELQGTIQSADANDPLWQELSELSGPTTINVDPEDTIRRTGEQADGTKSYQFSVTPKPSNLDTFLMMTDSSASDVFACRRNADSNESCTTATKRTEYRIPGRVKSKPLRLVVLHRGDLGNYDTILIPAKLGHDEFLSAEMINEADSVLEIPSSQFGLLGNLDVSLPLNAAMATFRIPSITNGPLKYTVQWSQHCKEPTQALFPPILHQSFRSTSEAKFLTDPTQSLITSYGHPKSAPWIQSDGLELRVLADPACGPLHLTLRIDWGSSLGAVVGRYMMTLVAFCFAVVVQLVGLTFESSGHEDSDRGFSRIAKLLIWKTIPKTVVLLFLLGLSQIVLLKLPLADSWLFHIRGLFLSTNGAFLTFLPPFIYCISAGLVMTLFGIVRVAGSLVGGLKLCSARSWMLNVLVALTFPASVMYLVMFLECLSITPRSRADVGKLSHARALWPTHEHAQAVGLLLLCCQVFIGPGLIIWARGLKHGWIEHWPSWDTADVVATIPAILYMRILSEPVLMRDQNKTLARLTQTLVRGIVLLAFLYGTQETYILFPAVSALLVWLSLVRLVPTFQEGRVARKDL